MSATDIATTPNINNRYSELEYDPSNVSVASSSHAPRQTSPWPRGVPAGCPWICITIVTVLLAFAVGFIVGYVPFVCKAGSDVTIPGPSTQSTSE